MTGDLNAQRLDAQQLNVKVQDAQMFARHEVELHQNLSFAKKTHHVTIQIIVQTFALPKMELGLTAAMENLTAAATITLKTILIQPLIHVLMLTTTIAITPLMKDVPAPLLALNNYV